MTARKAVLPRAGSRTSHSCNALRRQVASAGAVHAAPTQKVLHLSHIIEAPWVSTPATVAGRWRARRLNMRARRLNRVAQLPPNFLAGAQRVVHGGLAGVALDLGVGIADSVVGIEALSHKRIRCVPAGEVTTDSAPDPGRQRVAPERLIGIGRGGLAGGGRAGGRAWAFTTASRSAACTASASL
jgi:hypothetical protein